MSITFNSANNGASTTSASVVSYTHTISGTASLGFVAIKDWSGFAPTAVSWNGVSIIANLVNSQLQVAAGTALVSLYWVANPTTGTVSVTPNGGGNRTDVSSTAYSGSVTISPIDNTVKSAAAQNAGTITETLTTVADNCWAIMVAVDNTSATAASTNVTGRTTDPSGFARFLIGDSNGVIHPAGSFAMTMTCDATNSYMAAVAASFAPDTGVRYWVGGTGNWDMSSTTHWAYTSGGTAGAPAPTTNSTVIFDSSSGGGTTTLTASPTVVSVTMTGYTGTLALSSFTITLNGTGTVWTGGGTVNGGTGTIQITDVSSSSKTFAGGGLTYANQVIVSGSSGTYTISGNNIFNNFYFTGNGTGALTISGSNTFNDFKIDTPPHTVNFGAGTTQTLQTFTVNGTAGNLMTLQSTVSGSPWYLVKSTVGTVSCDYLSLKDSHVN